MLAGCQNPSPNSSESSYASITDGSDTSETSSESSSSNTSEHSSTTTEETSSSESEESSSSTSGTSVSSSSSTSHSEEGKILLDCGYYQMELPKNKTPYELKTTLSADDSSWSNNIMYDELPDDFRFIYGNSCDDGEAGQRAQPKFYSYNPDKTSQYPGGLKFDQVSKGFQTQLFIHSGKKLEIRLGISQVNNASGKPNVGEDTFRIYYFDNTGALLGKHAVIAETITTKTTEIKYYETSDFVENIAYFEVRQTAMAYKGQQCYNVGMSYCNFKSWERI